MDYSELRCPVCNKQFSNYDDIVVCPECGAPHHRECYEAENHCFYLDKHCEGFDFRKLTGDKSESGDVKFCSFCKSTNPSDSRYCNHCGLAFPDDDSTKSAKGSFDSDSGRRAYGESDDNQKDVYDQNLNSTFVIDPMGGVSPEDEVGDNITAGEAAKFVKSNTPFYSRLFSNIRKFNRSRFSFAGFLFSCVWVMYRKMYKIGMVLTAIYGLTMLASIYLVFVYQDTILSMQTQLYNISSAFWRLTFNSSALTGLNDFWASLSGEQMFAVIAFNLIGIIQTAIQVACGVYGNRWYYKHCMHRITEIKSDAKNEEEASAQLQTQGGVNFPVVISLCISYLILFYLPQFL